MSEEEKTTNESMRAFVRAINQEFGKDRSVIIQKKNKKPTLRDKVRNMLSPMKVKDKSCCNEVSDKTLASYVDKAKVSADELAAQGKYKKSTNRRMDVLRALGKRIDKTSSNINTALKKENADWVHDLVARAKARNPDANIRITTGAEKKKETEELLKKRAAERAQNPQKQVYVRSPGSEKYDLHGKGYDPISNRSYNEEVEQIEESKVVDKIKNHPAVEYYGGKDDDHFINLKPGFWHSGLEQRSFANTSASEAFKELKHVEKIPDDMKEEVEQLIEMPGANMDARAVRAHLRKKGWALARTSGGHDVYSHESATYRIAVPRHNKLKAPLVRSILKQSEIKEQAVPMSKANADTRPETKIGDKDISSPEKKKTMTHDQLSSIATASSRAKMKEETSYLEERLSKNDPPSQWIQDFIKSDNPKFAGKSKQERINMALGAYYKKKKG